MYYGKTDKGKVRKENQDNFECFEAAGISCLIVCDGMGGAKGGKVASDVCIKNISCVLKENLVKDMTEQEIMKIMKTAVKKANKEVFTLSRTDETLAGMGTTLVLALVRENRFFYTHLGDSRLYGIDSKEAIRLTKDHSFVQEMVNLGELTAEEAEHHPNKNIITNAIGIAEQPKFEIKADKLENRTLLLCSDGLSNMLSDKLIAELIRKYGVTQASVDAFIAAANKKGGTDNITVLVYGG